MGAKKKKVTKKVTRKKATKYKLTKDLGGPLAGKTIKKEKPPKKEKKAKLKTETVIIDGLFI